VASCAPQDLLTGTECWLCLPPLVQQAIRIVLLCAIKNGDTVICDPQTLQNEANCILSCVPMGSMAAVEIKLLCDIANNSGGNSCVSCGAGAPVAAPEGCDCGFYIDTTNGDLWKYYSGVWH
jgi:hypothetical protein